MRALFGQGGTVGQSRNRQAAVPRDCLERRADWGHLLLLCCTSGVSCKTGLVLVAWACLGKVQPMMTGQHTFPAQTLASPLGKCAAALTSAHQRNTLPPLSASGFHARAAGRPATPVLPVRASVSIDTAAGGGPSTFSCIAVTPRRLTTRPELSLELTDTIQGVCANAVT